MPRAAARRSGNSSIATPSRAGRGVGPSALAHTTRIADHRVLDHRIARYDARQREPCDKVLGILETGYFPDQVENQKRPFGKTGRSRFLWSNSVTLGMRGK